MSDDFGILAVGAYIPRRRLQRQAIHPAYGWFARNMRGLAKGEKAIANWDEDSVTMAVDAGRDCLNNFEGPQPETISIASTTLPFSDRLNAGIVKEALNLSDSTAALDMTGSLRAGTSALIQALKGATSQLCMAADNRKARPGSEAEMLQGDGAASILIGAGKPIATLLGHHSVTIDFVDHFKAAGEDYDYHWEKRWVRDEGYQGILGETIAKALSAIGITAGDIDHVLIPLPGKALPPKLINAAGFTPEAVSNTYHATIGYTGTAHPLLMLVSTLENAGPNETILLAGFGQGADVLVLKTTAHISKAGFGKGVKGHSVERFEDENYMRYLFHRDQIDLEKGMRAEFDEKQPGTSLSRNRKAALGLIGGKCTKTGTVQFPKTDISVSQNDRAIGTQEDYPLADKVAKITTFTADRLTYSPDPPTYYGMIDFEGGGRMISEFSDVSEEDVEVGRDMRMVFRIKARDYNRNFIKYFWKATPIRDVQKSEAE